MTDTTWLILGLAAWTAWREWVNHAERRSRQRDATETAAQAHAREQALLDRLMARDFPEYASFAPQRAAAPGPQLDPDVEAMRQAQQAVDLAGTIQ